MEKTLEDLGDKITEDDKSDIKSKIEEIRKIKDMDDVDSTEAKLDALIESMNKISEKIYSSAQAESTESEGPTGNDGPEDNLQEAEFEEVDAREEK